MIAGQRSVVTTDPSDALAQRRASALSRAPQPAGWRRRLRRSLAAGASAFLLIAVVVAGRGVVLRAVAGVRVDDAPTRSDYIVMLAGDPIRRPAVVADLVRKRVARTVLVTQTPPNEPFSTTCLRDLASRHGMGGDGDRRL
jgi:hypothetical protein